MKLIKIDTSEYPITEQEFRSRFPTTSFSAMLDKQVLSDFGYATVFPTPHTDGQIELDPILTDKGHYEEQWH